MKWISNACGRHRQDISLLASGALPEAERPAIERHLAGCADCRKYFVEMKNLTAPLAGWENHFADVEPSAAAQTRWTAAIQRAGQPERRDLLSPKSVLQTFWRELILPSRRLWTGLAAVWLLILAANWHLSAGAPRMTEAASRQTVNFIMALREQEQIMAELTERPEPKIAEPQKRFLPQPRSERRREFLMA